MFIDVEFLILYLTLLLQDDSKKERSAKPRYNVWSIYLFCGMGQHFDTKLVDTVTIILQSAHLLRKARGYISQLSLFDLLM